MKRARTNDHGAARPNDDRDHDSQVSRATLGLRDMLLRGALRPGRRISEIPLSAKLGVSRTPLRLAFEKLEHEGLIKALPGSGFTAVEFTLSDIWDAIETRSILEGASARLAAERLKDPSQLEHARSVNRSMESIWRLEFESLSQYLDLNEAFHLAILDLANNPVLRRALDLVYKVPFASPGSRVILSKAVAGAAEIHPIAEEHHRALLDAIEHREGARAEGLGREHARLTRVHLEYALADRGFLETIPGARLIQIRNTERA